MSIFSFSFLVWNFYDSKITPAAFKNYDSMSNMQIVLCIKN